MSNNHHEQQQKHTDKEINEQQYVIFVNESPKKRNQQIVTQLEKVNNENRKLCKSYTPSIKTNTNFIENNEEQIKHISQNQQKLTNLISKYNKSSQNKLTTHLQDFLKKISTEICPEEKYGRFLQMTEQFLESNKANFQFKKKNQKLKNALQLPHEKCKTNVKDKNGQKDNLILKDINTLTAQIKTFESLLDRSHESSNDLQSISHQSKAGSKFLGDHLQDISNYDDMIFDFSPPNNGEEKVYLNCFPDTPKTSRNGKVNTFKKINEIADDNTVASVYRIRQIFKDELRRTKVMVKLNHRNNKTERLKPKRNIPNYK